MLLLAPAMIHESGSLLVSDLKDGNVRLKIVSLAGGTERVIDSRRLAFRVGGDTDSENHNESLVRSFAFAVDKKRRRIAALNIVGYRRAPTMEDGSPIYGGWSSDADVLTLDYGGRTLRRRRINIAADGTAYLGFDETGCAEVIWKGGLNLGKVRYERLSGGGSAASSLPASFRDAESRLGLDRRLVERVLLPEDQKSNLLYPFPGGTSWVNIELPTFMSPGYPLYGSIDRGRRASAVWSIGDIAASWGGRRFEASFGGVSLQQISLLDYPTVVGRVRTSRELLPEYRDFPLLPIEPYVPSEIRTFDLATQKFKKVCSGVYALPL